MYSSLTNRDKSVSRKVLKTQLSKRPQSKALSPTSTKDNGQKALFLSQQTN